MESTILFIHSWLRWIVAVLAVIALFNSWSGWLGKKEWTNRDNNIGFFFLLSVHLQAVVGLILYFFFSPIVSAALADMGAAMGNKILRFYAVEHISIMLIATILITIGRSKSRKAADAVKKHKLAAIFFTIGIILILISIPWPGSEAGRPLFRF